jgi:FkbM family methyltransferase
VWIRRKKVVGLTLRQKIASRLAQTARRLLGLEQDRTLLEDKIDRLERQLSELLLHGRRTAQVESRIDQTHRQLQALEDRVQSVKDLAAAVPEIATSTKGLRSDIRQTRTFIDNHITHTASALTDRVTEGQQTLAKQVSAAQDNIMQATANAIAVESLNQQEALANRSESIAQAIMSLQVALSQMDSVQHAIGQEHRRQLEDLMIGALARLDSQAEHIRHAHQILLNQPIYLGTGLNAVVRVGGWDGHPVSVPTSHAGVVHGHYVSGAASGEPGVRAAIRALVKEGMCAIDIGAHVGIHSVIMGFHVGETGRLICFEPDPDLAAALGQTILMNGYAHKAQVINAAVADCAARLAFFRTPHSPESTLFPATEMTERDTIDVEVTSLDLALPAGTKVDFLKIDAEGAEARIYRGMRRVLEENPALSMIVEFAPEHFGRAGEDPKHYLETALRDGFSLATVEEPSGLITPISIDQALQAKTLNLLLQRT